MALGFKMDEVQQTLAVGDEGLLFPDRGGALSDSEESPDVLVELAEAAAATKRSSAARYPRWVPPPRARSLLPTAHRGVGGQRDAGHVRGYEYVEQWHGFVTAGDHGREQ